MSCSTAIGKAYDQLECRMKGDEVEIGFNNRYMLEAAARYWLRSGKSFNQRAFGSNESSSAGGRQLFVSDPAGAAEKRSIIFTYVAHKGRKAGENGRISYFSNPD